MRRLLSATSFRRRIALAATAAVAIAVVLASVATYIVVRDELRHEIDKSLTDRVSGIDFGARIFTAPSGLRRFGGRGLDRPGLEQRALGGIALQKGAPGGLPPGQGGLAAPALKPAPGGPPAGVQASPFTLPTIPPSRTTQDRGSIEFVTRSGRTFPAPGNPLNLPVDRHVLAVAAAGKGSYLSDAHVNGQHVRVVTAGIGPGLAVRIARSLTEDDHVLSNLRLIFAVLDLAGIALAAGLGLAVAGATVAPVKRLTEATEHVTQTQDLTSRIEVDSRDELGRLARSFNEMLDALEHSMSALDASVRAQRQLIADASHELRTPITSLRTNIEILQRSDQLPAAERERLRADIVAQIEELTLLMNDLIELARDDEPRADAEDVRFDTLVAEAAERARLHAPQTRFELSLQEMLIWGVPGRLDRAVNNLIDNAVKWSAPGDVVEITLRDGELRVRDHGPGIDPVDLPHIFDRFYRGHDARERPGSGLGLAIVRQVAESHGGSVTAERAEGGGTLMRLRLPDGHPTPDGDAGDELAAPAGDPAPAK